MKIKDIDGKKSIDVVVNHPRGVLLAVGNVDVILDEKNVELLIKALESRPK